MTTLGFFDGHNDKDSDDEGDNAPVWTIKWKETKKGKFNSHLHPQTRAEIDRVFEIQAMSKDELKAFNKVMKIKDGLREGILATAASGDIEKLEGYRSHEYFDVVWEGFAKSFVGMAALRGQIAWVEHVRHDEKLKEHFDMWIAFSDALCSSKPEGTELAKILWKDSGSKAFGGICPGLSHATHRCQHAMKHDRIKELMRMDARKDSQKREREEDEAEGEEGTKEEESNKKRKVTVVEVGGAKQEEMDNLFVYFVIPHFHGCVCRPFWKFGLAMGASRQTCP